MSTTLPLFLRPVGDLCVCRETLSPSPRSSNPLVPTSTKTGRGVRKTHSGKEESLNNNLEFCSVNVKYYRHSKSATLD